MESHPVVIGAVIVKNSTKPRRKAALTHRYKLTNEADFKGVFKKPFVSSDAFFKVLAQANQSDFSRLGMAVSRQIDKRAVGRNRIKRVVRESFRRYNAEHGACLDIVVLPRRQTATICNEKLFNSLKHHWSRLENQFEG